MRQQGKSIARTCQSTRFDPSAAESDIPKVIDRPACHHQPRCCRVHRIRARSDRTPQDRPYRRPYPSRDARSRRSGRHDVAARRRRRFLPSSRGRPIVTKRHYGFPTDTIVCVNDEIVHGIPKDRLLQQGDLVTFDVVAERGGYIEDAALTVGVGEPSPTHRRLVACTQRALGDALGVARAGRRIRHIGRAVERTVEQAGFSVVKQLTGHGVGREIHEWPSVPNYDAPWAKQRLETGQVITIEPIVSAGSGEMVEGEDGWTVSTSDGAYASHHEHSVVITKGPPIVLTAAA